MKTLSFLFCFTFGLLINQPAMAGWADNQIGDVIEDIEAVKEEIVGETGNAKVVAEEFREQLRDLVEKGLILRESVEDFLTWWKTRAGPYRVFVGSADSPRCSTGTPCSAFRDDLAGFFLETGNLRNNFPIIEKSGLGDGSRAAEIVNRSPPIILFGIYEVLNRTPDWQRMPADLQSIFDEIGDPDVFSVELDEIEESFAASSSLTSAGLFSRTPTQRFCDRWERRVDNEMDPVRVNRIELRLFATRKILGILEGLTSPTLGITLFGEGNETLIPNPLKAVMQVIVVVYDVTQKSVQMFRDNLGVCRAARREIEMQVAQCIQLVDFVMPSKRDAVFHLVQTKVQNAADEFIPTTAAARSLAAAASFRDAGKFKQAYLKLCDAYRQIGN